MTHWSVSSIRATSGAYARIHDEYIWSPEDRRAMAERYREDLERQESEDGVYGKIAAVLLMCELVAALVVEFAILLGG